MQESIALIGGSIRRLLLPAPQVPVLPGLAWGHNDQLFTPAYWAAQTWMWAEERPDHYRLGRSLEEELIACLLGGHGIPAEVGLAAYDRIRSIIHASPDRLASDEEIETVLSEPLDVGGRSVRYRFARQKAAYVGAARRFLKDLDEAARGDRELRLALMNIPGVGPKTSAWAVRNWRGSDDVAIIDIHILRAGRILGIFEARLTPERHYLELEDRFLAFARAAGVQASLLDSVMWMTMRQLPASMVASLLTQVMPAHRTASRRRAILNNEGARASL